VVAVPDFRLDKLADLAKSKKLIPTTIEFFDIAGLVAGASKGEGLGNTFLSHIREVDAIVHVVRCFEDENITHVVGSVDPNRDIEIINTELLLKDMDTLERRIERASKLAKSGLKDSKNEFAFYESLMSHLSAGNPARSYEVGLSSSAWYSNLFLLTAKPVLYAANVAEDELTIDNAHVQIVRHIAQTEHADAIVFSAEFEAQLAELDPEERIEFLEAAGLAAPGLDRLIRSAYQLLGLITFFTAGPKESRAWTIREGTKAPQAAGVIHSDFERGFIRAETIKFADYEVLGSEMAAREAGMMRSEGRVYTVQDGDVLLFRFNV
jgi:GTP-binding protein YchF